MANMFISKSIQTVSQCKLVITITVPRMTVAMVMIKIRGFISTGRI